LFAPEDDGLTTTDIEKWFGAYHDQYGLEPEASRV
jgi:hypothetical protein